MTVTERDLTEPELLEFARCRETGLRLLGMPESEEPIAIVRTVNGFITALQRRKRGLFSRFSWTDAEYEKARALSVVWGDQIVRHFGWEWIVEVREGNELFAVASKDRSLVIHTPVFLSVCLDEPQNDCTVLLAFNMQEEGKFAGRQSGEYVSVMDRVRRAGG